MAGWCGFVLVVLTLDGCFLFISGLIMLVYVVLYCVLLLCGVVLLDFI